MPSRPYIDIPIGALNPDIGGAPGAEAPGYLVQGDGVMSTVRGYRSLPAMAEVDSTTALPGLGVGRLFTASNGTTLNIFACSTNMPSTADVYIRQSQNYGVAWSDVVGSSGAPGTWPDFCQFEELVICGSRSRVPQEKSLFDAVGTAFSDLGGSPPTGATIARVRDHVVIGNLTVGDLEKHAVQWCAIDDPADWPTPGTADALAKESGRQYLPLELGQVTKIVGGEKFGLIFQQRGITRMTYVGGSTVYEFDTFEKKIGTGSLQTDDATSVVVAHPVVQADNIFLWANVLFNSGVYATDGYSIRKLSTGVLDQQTPLSLNLSAAYDDRKRIVVFGGANLIYSLDTNAFTYANDTNLTRTVVDSPINDGENDKPIISVMAAGRKLSKMDSSTQQTVALQTGYVEVDSGRMAYLDAVELLGADLPGNLALSYKAALDTDDLDTSSSGFVAMTAAPRGNKFTARASGQFFAFRVTGVPSATQLIRGLRIYFSRAEPAQ